jgi:hypothetical protein
MNIFLLDYDIKKCAQDHCDKHVVKMCIEYAQLLSSVHHMLGKPAGYGLTHKNHPCAVWARASMNNYEWLFNLAIELGDEYTHRYGKSHKSIQLIETLPIPELEYSKQDPFPKCVRDELKAIPDVVDAYRMYYNTDKAYMCTWKRRDTPSWFQNIGL